MAWQKTVLNVKNLSTPYMVHTILNKCSDSGMEVSAERPTDQPTEPTDRLTDGHNGLKEVQKKDDNMQLVRGH